MGTTEYLVDKAERRRINKGIEKERAKAQRLIEQERAKAYAEKLESAMEFKKMGLPVADDKELAIIASRHGLQTAHFKAFVEDILNRMIFDGEKLTDLSAPLELSWKERRVEELALMEDLMPQLKKLVQGRDIAGLAAYE